eukprot:m51a1_g707 hypothetical protein (697) ;mRNA; f:400225-402884
MEINQTWAIASSAFFLLAVVVVLFLRRYIAWTKEEWYTPPLTFVGWYLSFSVALLLPLDLSASAYHNCMTDDSESSAEGALAGVECHAPLVILPQRALLVAWNVIYWGAFVLCWFVYPLLQSYITAGYFTVCERWCQSVKENLIFYGICALALAVFAVGFVLWGDRNVSGLIYVGMALANAWGLGLLLVLLGYGLVEIPRGLWRSGSLIMTLKKLEFEAKSLKSKVHDCRDALFKTVSQIRKYDDTVDRSDPYRKYVDMVVRKCPEDLYEKTSRGHGSCDILYSKLVHVHYNLIWQKLYLNQAEVQYNELLLKAFAIEDVLKAKQNGTRGIRWTAWRPRCRPSSGAYVFAEYLWCAYLRPLCLRLLSVVCACLSLVIIWSECTFWVDRPVLSVLALMTTPDVIRQSDVLLSLVFSVPLLYMVVCAYWSTLRMRLFNYYRLLPHQQTDGNSIVFSAALLCRLAAPLALNFTNMQKFETSAFQTVMQGMKRMPIVGGKSFNQFAPMCLVFFCVCTLFNCVTHCARLFGVRRFEYDDDFDDDSIEDGRRIISEERTKVAHGYSCDSSRAPATASLHKLGREQDDIETGGGRRSKYSTRHTMLLPSAKDRLVEPLKPKRAVSARVAPLSSSVSSLRPLGSVQQQQQASLPVPQIAPPPAAPNSRFADVGSRRALGQADTMQASARALSEWTRNFSAQTPQ